MRHVVIEQPSLFHLPLLSWYRLRGARLYYIRQPRRPMMAAIVARWEAGGGLERMALTPPLFIENNPAADLAFAETEVRYPAEFSDRPLIRNAVDDIGDAAVHLAFKKALVIAQQRAQMTALLCARIARTLVRTQTIEFLPVDWPAAVKMDRDAAVTVVLPWWGTLVATAQDAADKAISFGILAWSLVVGVRPVPAVQRGAEIGIMIISPLREFSNETRSVDFLLDGTRIRKDNTLFIPVVPLTEEQKAAIGRSGLRLVPRVRALNARGMRMVGRWILRLAKSARHEPAWLVRTTALLIREYYAWLTFMDRCSLRHLVTYADFGMRHYGRNLALRRHAVTTWYYADATNTSDVFYAQDNGVPHRHVFWGYLFYDNIVSWGPRHIRYMRMHCQGVGRYLPVGCLWSQHVAEFRNGTRTTGLLSLIQQMGWSPGLRLVAVCDSTYDNDAMTPYVDGVAFAAGVQRLLAERGDIFVIFKEKKDRAYHRAHGSHGQLEALYGELEAHPRCWFVGHRASTAELSALCDLTISFPFSSTALEALCAGRRALYYDPLRKYDRSPYLKIPGLVAQGEAELSARVAELLDTMPDAEWETFLREHIQDEADPYLDGRAISRFRALLFETAMPANRGTAAPAATRHTIGGRPPS